MHEIEQLALIWIGVFIAALLARKVRLTPVLLYLAIGAIYVNLGLLPKESGDFIRGFSDIGIILIMFALGFEENTSTFLKSIRRSWGIALFGAVAPFVAAYAAIFAFWPDHNVAMLSGLAMTATAVSLTLVSLKSENLQKTPAATGIMTSAVLDDIGSLALVAILVPIASGATAPTPDAILWTIAKAVIFFGLVSILGAWILPHELPGQIISRAKFLSGWGARNLFVFDDGRHAVLAALTIALLLGIAAHAFGFHPAVGAYMAGLVMRTDYFHLIPDQSEAAYENVKKIVDNVAFSWIGPVFFVSLGAKIVFDLDLFVSVIPQTATLVAALLIAQILSAALAARYTGDFPWPDSVMIGFGMLGRAELAFVVLDIAYIQTRIISEDVFYTLMVTAFCLNVAVPVLIAWWKPYYNGEKTMGFLAPPRSRPPAS
ncbi:MAG: cation:proton antiporter [Parvularculaceae bacterium]|nr:cation:proton antiporter [Parvularculaceae bacterium]